MTSSWQLKHSGLQTRSRHGLLWLSIAGYTTHTGCTCDIEHVAEAQAWQDDEWQVQENHHDLGIAVAKVSDVMLASDSIEHRQPPSC
jgi:hypothetical protein